MTRQKLLAAVETACKAAGFDFETGFEYRLASQVDRLPAAWLETPQLQKTEGRNEGVKHYSLKINLLTRCTDHTPAAKERDWAALEQSAAEILAGIRAAEGVKAVEDVALAPAEFSLTTGGELSMCVSGVAVLRF